MKLCQKCVDEIKRTGKEVGHIEFERFDVMSPWLALNESKCEFWAHKKFYETIKANEELIAGLIGQLQRAKMGIPFKDSPWNGDPA